MLDNDIYLTKTRTVLEQITQIFGPNNLIYRLEEMGLYIGQKIIKFRKDIWIIGNTKIIVRLPQSIIIQTQKLNHED